MTAVAADRADPNDPYDPFTRGPHPVGVRTVRWVDDVRDRSLDVEVWYPADPRHAGEDLDPATQDRFEAVWTAGGDEPGQLRQAAVREAVPARPAGPLLVFSHGYAGFRREATFLCTHLASHGFVVVGADHVGSTSWDVAEGFDPADPDPIRSMAIARKGDVPFLVAQARAEGLGDGDEVGVVGISMGGWTTLVSPSVEPRVRALVALCPAGGASPVAPVREALRDELVVEWDPAVATLVGVADQDSWLPLHGQLEILTRLPGHPRMVVLRRADHNHFVDDIEMGHEWFRDYTRLLADAYGEEPTPWGRIAGAIAPFAELTPAEPASALWRGLAVAQFDAHLRRRAAAAALLDGDLVGAAAGIGAPIVTLVR